MAKFGYIGNQPDASSVIVARQIYTATGSVGTITFGAGYTPGYLDVYLNGIRLVEAQDFSASDGSTIILTTDTNSGDVIEMVAYKALNISTSPIGIQSAGTLIRDNVTTLNFIGAGNTFAINGSTVDISISGGGGGSVGVSSNSLVDYVGTGITHFNFIGAAVTAVGLTTANVTINKTFTIGTRAGAANLNVTSGIATIGLRTTTDPSGVGTIRF